MQKGDLLIYSQQFRGTGHVAVVSEVDSGNKLIYVSEQNNFNAKWENDYARAIPYVLLGGNIWVLDAYLIGWKRVNF